MPNAVVKRTRDGQYHPLRPIIYIFLYLERVNVSFQEQCSVEKSMGSCRILFWFLRWVQLDAKSSTLDRLRDNSNTQIVTYKRYRLLRTILAGFPPHAQKTRSKSTSYHLSFFWSLSPQPALTPPKIANERTRVIKLRPVYFSHFYERDRKRVRVNTWPSDLLTLTFDFKARCQSPRPGNPWLSRLYRRLGQSSVGHPWDLYMHMNIKNMYIFNHNHVCLEAIVF